MRLDILDKTRIDLINQLNTLPFIDNFYLAGGTGLSLVYGYRESVDFDFFTNTTFNPDEILYLLKEKFGENNIEVINKTINFPTLNLFINKVQVSFFFYCYKNLFNHITDNDFKHINIASIYDIACMKASAITQRGSKKDFFDLYQIIKEAKLNEIHLIKLLYEKFNDKNFVINFVYSCQFFDDADKEQLSKTFVDYSWEEIKKFFINFSNKIFKIINKNS